jgi:hypothetical protein
MALSDKKVPANFHALYDLSARAARGLVANRAAGVRHKGIERLAADVPDLAVHLDEATQMPVSIQARTSGKRMSERAASPEAAVQQFVRSRADLWNLSDADTNTLEIDSVSRQGLPTVRLIQKMDGVEVFQGELKAAVDSDNNVLSVTGQAFTGAGSPASRVKTKSRAGRLSPEAAIAKAASDLTGLQHSAKDFKISGKRTKSDPYRHYAFKAAKSDKRPGFERPVRLKDVMFPMGEGQFIPGYYIELWVNDFNDQHDVHHPEPRVRGRPARLLDRRLSEIQQRPNGNAAPGPLALAHPCPQITGCGRTSGIGTTSSGTTSV